MKAVRLLTAILAIAGSVALHAAPASAACASPVTTLVLYDTTGQFGQLGERYATMTTNLVSRFGTWRAEPVVDYQAGDLACASATIYIGSTYDEPIPDAFLDDVAAATTPVMWIWENLWQLSGRLPVLAGTGSDPNSYDRVQYKGQELSRNAPVDAGLSTQSPAADAEVLATASGPDAPIRPWALRKGNLMYLSENPLAYISGTDRYLVFNDLLFELIAPTTPERHRALVRLEDITPILDPSYVKTSVDALVEEGVPFALAVIPEYHDGKGGPIVTLKDRPEMVATLHYAVAHGGTLVLHGVSHQVDGIDNPYNGVSAADYEFFRATIDAQDNVVLQGPVEGDSYEKVHARLEQGIQEFVDAGLPRPEIITPPHYAASAVDYAAMADLFEGRFDRGLYFDDQLSTGTADEQSFYDQFFAYPVTDVHGMTVVPENLGNESPEIQNNHPARGVDDLVVSAKAALVVRDGFAAFFWHPYLVGKSDVGIAHLHQIVQGLKQLGYSFVSLGDVVPGAGQYAGEIPAPKGFPKVRPYQVLAVVLAIWLPLRWWRKNRPQRPRGAEDEAEVEGSLPVPAKMGR